MTSIHFHFVCLLIFGCAGFSLLQGRFSSYSGWKQCGVWAVGGAGFSNCGSLALGHRLDSFCTGAQLPHGMILPDQGSNPCLLNWQADSLPLSHQGSPGLLVDFPLLDSDL